MSDDSELETKAIASKTDSVMQQLTGLGTTKVYLLNNRNMIVEGTNVANPLPIYETQVSQHFNFDEEGQAQLRAMIIETLKQNGHFKINGIEITL